MRGPYSTAVVTSGRIRDSRTSSRARHTPDGVGIDREARIGRAAGRDVAVRKRGEEGDSNDSSIPGDSPRDNRGSGIRAKENEVRVSVAGDDRTSPRQDGTRTNGSSPPSTSPPSTAPTVTSGRKGVLCNRAAARGRTTSSCRGVTAGAAPTSRVGLRSHTISEETTGERRTSGGTTGEQEGSGGTTREQEGSEGTTREQEGSSDDPGRKPIG